MIVLNKKWFIFMPLFENIYFDLLISWSNHILLCVKEADN